MSAQQSRAAWGTSQELDFLLRLGKVPLRVHADAAGFTRRELLEGYRKAIQRRVVWGQIDRHAILEYLILELSNAKSQPLVVSTFNNTSDCV